MSIEEREYLTEKEAKTVKEMFRKYLKSYKEKDSAISDQEWLEQLFRTELPEMKEEEIKQDSEEIVNTIEAFDKNLDSCNEAAKNGVSKESWLADKIQEASVGMAVNEYGRTLQQMNDVLYAKNAELAEALSRSSDGHIMMSPNLDGNIAENMIAKTTELSASLQGKNISVEVLESHAANSVDVRAINHDTGQYQNYQLKFGKDAKGKSFTKEEMKKLQEKAQSEGIAPELDYSHYQTKDLAISIGKNAGVMALQAAAVTTGLNIAAKIFEGEEIDGDELVETAIKTGADTSVKLVAAGTLQVAVGKGLIRLIPKMTPPGVIANIACVGIENIKILGKIASGDLSVTKGLDQMGRVTTSMVGGLWGMAKGTAIGAKLAVWIPVIGPGLAVVTGFVGGMVGYFGGSKMGDAIYNAGKKVAGAAKTVAKAAWNGIKSAGRAAVNGAKSVGRAIASLFGF